MAEAIIAGVLPAEALDLLVTFGVGFAIGVCIGVLALWYVLSAGARET